MRLVTKINLALAGVVAVSAVLNFATLRLAVLPSFAALEEQTAERNQSRVIEAIQLQQEQVANSAGDYAIWDDTYDFMSGQAAHYQEKNVTAESLKTLGINYFVALDPQGRIILDSGFDGSGDQPMPVKLFKLSALPSKSPLLAKTNEIKVQSALMRTDEGLVVIGFSPILRSDRSGERAGTLVLGRILDIDDVKATTRVDFDLLPGIATPAEAEGADGHLVNKIDRLKGINGEDVATLVSHTQRDITAVGERTILTTLAFLLVSAALLLVALGFVLRQIAIRRIETLQSHLITVASTGNLEAMAEDDKGDELSETVQSFNQMAKQLAELRDKLRRQDYDHGAADQAAGLLHNVRNAISPVSALAWELSKTNETPWKQNLAKAFDQLQEPGLAPERAGKLNQFVAMSAARLIEDEEKRQETARNLVMMLRHIDDILRETDKSAQLERILEIVDVPNSMRQALHLVGHRDNIEVDCSSLHSVSASAHKVTLDQVIANLLINATEAIDSSEAGAGTIRITSGYLPATEGETRLELAITDDGMGIEACNLTRIFEKGYTTKIGGKRGVGLHWCANAINAMGGRLVADSAGPGTGATFTIFLPAANSSREAA